MELPKELPNNQELLDQVHTLGVMANLLIINGRPADALLLARKMVAQGELILALDFDDLTDEELDIFKRRLDEITA